MRKLFVMMLVGLLIVGVAIAKDQKDEAKEMVEKAAAFYKDNGKEKALAEFSSPKGQFVKGDLYVFAYDLNAAVLAHPINAKLIGKNLFEVPDVDGKFFRKEIVEVAKTKGSGWVDYKYSNPETKKVEAKTTYIQKVGDIIVCCGTYK